MGRATRSRKENLLKYTDHQVLDDTKLKLGTDADYSLRYDSSTDQYILRDEANGVDLMKVPKNTAVQNTLAPGGVNELEKVKSVKRNASGAVVFKNVNSGSWTGVGTATVTHTFTTTQWANFTKMAARLGTATTAYLTVLRNGSVIASTTVTGTGAAASITVTNTASLTGTNKFTVKGHFGSGTGTLSFTPQINDRFTHMLA